MRIASVLFYQCILLAGTIPLQMKGSDIPHIYQICIEPFQLQAIEGYSLDAQEHILTDRCKQEGWEIVDIYTDAGLSGKDIDHRPAMQQLITDAKLRRFDLVLIWSLSRFSRSVSDLYNACKILRDNNVSLISITEAFDTNTPTGRAMMGMLGVFAQMEREITSERVQAAMFERASQGKRTCNEVLGYNPLGKDDLVINPKELLLIHVYKLQLA